MKPSRLLTRLTLGAAFLATACMDPAPTGVAHAPDQAAATLLDAHTVLIAQRDSARAAMALTTKSLDATFKTMLSAWKVGYKSSGGATYLSCMPQAYAGWAEVIGPEGGSLKVGPHVLTVPAGALTKEYLFIGERPMGDLVEADFRPEGLKFAVPATLKLDYKACVFPPPVPFRGAYVDGKKNFLEWEPSKDDKFGKVVTVTISHFSGYIIAY